MFSLFQKIKIAALATLLVLTISERAFADVTAEVFPDEGTVDDTFRLEVTIKGGDDFSKPRFKRDENFTLESAGTTTSQTIINSAVSSEHSFTYRLVPNSPLQPGKYNTPAGELDIDGKTYPIEPKPFNVTTPSANSSKKIKQIDFAQTIDNHRPFVGQQILHTTKLATTIEMRNPIFSDFVPSGFWKESFGDQAQQQRRVGSSTVMVNFYEALFPLQPGKLEIPPRKLTADAAIPQKVPEQRRGSSVIEQFLMNEVMQFGLNSYQEVTLTTDPLSLLVRELPAAPEKVNYIPVGKLALESSFDKSSGKTGESFTLTVVISGDANLRPLSLPEFPEETQKLFRIYSDSPELETGIGAGRVIFTKTFKLAFVPQRSGTLEIPELKVLTFDPDSAQYLWLETASTALKVAPSAQAPESPTADEPKSTEGVNTPSKTETDSSHDIKEIYSGNTVLHNRAPLSCGLIVAILCLAPLLFAALYFKSWLDKKKANNPQYFLRKQAQLTAIKSLSASELSAELIFSTFQTFLSQFFAAPYNTTVTELTSKIEKSGGTEQLADDVAQFQKQLEAIRFSGQSPDKQQLASLKENLLQIVKKIVSQTKIVLLLLLLASWSPHLAVASDDATTELTAAEKAYRAGEFQTALENYKMLAGKFNSPEIDYNLGNIYFRLQKYGLAKAYFLRAKSQLPRDEKIAYNLLLTDQKLGNPSSTPPPFDYWFPRQSLNPQEITSLFLISYLLFWAIATISIRKKRSLVIILLLVGICSLYFASLKYLSCQSPTGEFGYCAPSERTSLGVIIADSANVRTGDAEHYLVASILKAGQTVSILQDRAGWFQIIAPDGSSGWVIETELLPTHSLQMAEG